jgi:eukaryotic translation initiation factor 2C
MFGVDDFLINFFSVISAGEKILPARLNMDLIKTLQTVVEPKIFTPRAVYDGRKNLFAGRELPLGSTSSREVCFLCYARI